MQSQFKLIAFDVEGTLTQDLIWPQLNEIAGISFDEDSKWFTQYYTGLISFDRWVQLLIDRYRQSQRKRQEFEAIFKKTSLIPGAQEIIKKLSQKYTLCLVSSAVDIFVKHVAEQLKISIYHANYSFKYDDQEKIVDIQYEAPENEAKVIFLQKICEAKNIKSEEIVFVGDSSNDLEAFQFTKHGILVGAGNEALKKAAWKQIEKLEDIEKILLD